MKRALLLSGSGKGAHYAGYILGELRRRGIPVDLVCASSVPAAALLLWRIGVSEKEMSVFLEEQNGSSLETAARLLRSLRQRAVLQSRAVPLAVCTVEKGTGRPVIFYDGRPRDVWNWRTAALTGNEMIALRGGSSPALGYAPARWEDGYVWDYAMKYGLPVQVSRMEGAKRVAAIVFAGGETPAQMAAESLLEKTSVLCDAFFSLRLQSGAIRSQIKSFLREAEPVLLEKLLF